MEANPVSHSSAQSMSISIESCSGEAPPTPPSFEPPSTVSVCIAEAIPFPLERLPLRPSASCMPLSPFLVMAMVVDVGVVSASSSTADPLFTSTILTSIESPTPSASTVFFASTSFLDWLSAVAPVFFPACPVASVFTTNLREVNFFESWFSTSRLLAVDWLVDMDGSPFW